MHGYDNDEQSMQAMFIGFGPSFQRGVEVPKFNSVELYSLFCNLLNLKNVPTYGVNVHIWDQYLRNIHRGNRPQSIFSIFPSMNHLLPS